MTLKPSDSFDPFCPPYAFNFIQAEALTASSVQVAFYHLSALLDLNQSACSSAQQRAVISQLGHGALSTCSSAHTWKTMPAHMPFPLPSTQQLTESDSTLACFLKLATETVMGHDLPKTKKLSTYTMFLTEEDMWQCMRLAGVSFACMKKRRKTLGKSNKNEKV